MPSKIRMRCLAACLFFGAGLSGIAQTPAGTPSCPDPTQQDCGLTRNPTQQSFPPDVIQPQPPSSSTMNYGQAASSNNQVYVDQAGKRRDQPGMSTTSQANMFPPDKLIDLQKLAQSSLGELLPVFGRDLFRQAPSTFAPTDQVPALSDYVVGPGDVILLRLWGPEAFNGQLTVDSSGSVYVPQVGSIHVAGLRIDELQSHISQDVRHTYKNFNLSVELGSLRSIQVYVVGEARRPGVYTVSSLSTILNVLFVAGGPSVQGSLRHIQVRRGGELAADLDLYDLILKGQKSHDIRLQPGDTIFIPEVGAQVAVGGSVRRPAIYELRDETTLGDLLDLAGGFDPTAVTSQVSIERIEQANDRAAMTVKLDATGRSVKLRDGDVIYADHITSAYEQSVTIRGNLANPGRFPWHPGMRLTDIIPERKSLLTRNYWEQRNKLGLPVPLFVPERRNDNLPWNDREPNRSYDPNNPNRLQDANGSQARLPASGERTDAAGLDSLYQDGMYQDPSVERSLQGDPRNDYRQTTGQDGRGTNPGTSDETLTRGSVAEQQQSVASSSIASYGRPNSILIPAPEIDWSYSVIERLNPDTLRNSLVPFSLRGLLQDHDPSQNLELQPGDIVTILSQADVHVPQDDQTKYIRLEGEFKGAGVYSVGPDETLYDVVRRAGGLSSRSYLYGASFTRESSRVFQQQRLDEYISSVSINMERALSVRAVSSTGAVDPNAFAEQREIIAQLRRLRATGRVVLEFRPESAGLDSIPRIPLEDGDVFRVPSRPLVVNVVGAVYGQNVFLYDPKRRVEDYLLLAGKANPIADRKHAFIIRADGSVFSRERVQGVWKNGFDAMQIYPGDSIVVPEQPIKPSFVRQFIDYSQIFSQFALGAAAITVIKQ